MAAIAAGDLRAAFSLYVECGQQIKGALRRILRAHGIEHVDPDDLDGLALDACLAIADRAGAWRPDGGALPWIWAERRLHALVSKWVGQHADPLHDDLALTDPGAAGLPAGGDDPEELDVLSELAARSPGCALVLEALERVASPRDQQIVLEVRTQLTSGDPSPAITVAARFDMTSDAVRQVVSRVRRRLLDLAGREARFAPLAALALVA